MIAAALAPHLIWLRLAGYGVLIAVGFFGGYRWMAGEVADAESAQSKAEAARDAWKKAAEDRESAVLAQQKANAAIKAEAEKSQQLATLAQVAAQGAKADADKRMAKFDAELARARSKPDCNALLNADWRRVCGLR